MDPRPSVKRRGPCTHLYPRARRPTQLVVRNAALAALLIMTTTASADGWLVAETPAAVAVSDAQAGVFKPGVMPAVGAYADRGWLALGVRLRSGVLRDGAAPGNHFKDPHLGSLTTASLALRALAFGGGVEGTLGGGVTGSDLVPSAELGAGFTFPVGAVEMGPSLRFARVAGDGMTLGTADLVLLGLDLRFGKDHERRTHRRAHVEAAVEPMPFVAEADHDQIVERLPSCAELVDGCTFGAITIVDDRIVLDDRVLFDLDRARVKHAGKQVIEAIAKLWEAHPEWVSITIEGHADIRGSDDYNLDLSQRRADHVRDALIESSDPTRVKAIGYGRTRPRDPGTTVQAHQHNRRVEFVIERHTETFQ